MKQQDTGRKIAYYTGAGLTTTATAGSLYTLIKLLDNHNRNNNVQKHIASANQKIFQLNDEQKMTKSDVALTISGTAYEVSGNDAIRTISPVPYAKLIAEQKHIIMTSTNSLSTSTPVDTTSIMMIGTVTAFVVAAHWGLGANREEKKDQTKLSSFYDNAGAAITNFFTKKDKPQTLKLEN